MPRGTTVLQIGDSMADALGSPLREELQKAGVVVVNRTKTGSHIPLWGGRFSNVPDMVRAYKPDLVVINLGGNDLLIQDPSDRVDPIKRLVEFVGDRPCVWIAPPLWKAGETGVLAMIREHSKPCRFFDTNAVIPNLERTRADPIHPAPPARRQWARAFVEWLARERDPDGARPWDLRPERPNADELPDDLDPYE